MVKSAFDFNILGRILAVVAVVVAAYLLLKKTREGWFQHIPQSERGKQRSLRAIVRGLPRSMTWDVRKDEALKGPHF